jgi:hypothetical protein
MSCPLRSHAIDLLYQARFELSVHGIITDSANELDFWDLAESMAVPGIALQGILHVVL